MQTLMSYVSYKSEKSEYHENTNKIFIGPNILKHLILLFLINSQEPLWLSKLLQRTLLHMSGLFLKGTIQVQVYIHI